ncbi:MAG: metallophosphoesterase [Deltaproteobacteria bacterium]|nr:metallophosphoesterase [Deltaproteobacteria bacterium]
MWLILSLACSGKSDPVPPDPTGDSPIGTLAVPPPTFIDEMPPRLVALGDVHGDLAAARAALRLAGAIDFENRWIGGDLVVVQTGDQLDRGDQERQILELFEELAVAAHEAGGAFYSLLGNHEIMNVEGDFRYVTDAGFGQFADFPFDPEDPYYAELEEGQQGRAAAFRPGGPWAVTLAGHNVVMVIGDTGFVHGGILPTHVDHGLRAINNETQAWMRGEGDEPSILQSDSAPIWTRAYSDDVAEPDCESLQETIDLLDLKRLVVGHTVWPEINAACDDQVWRIDVGMSEYYGGIPMGLEIVDGEVTLLE